MQAMPETDTLCLHASTARVAPLVNGVRLDPIRIWELAPRISSFLDCRGSHVVHFVGHQQGFSLNVTYNLTVQ